MSEENVEVVRRALAQLATPIRAEEVERRLSDSALAEFFDPKFELLPAGQSLMALDTYRGYEGMRRFFTDFLSIWEGVRFEPREFIDADDQVAAFYRVAGRSHSVDVDATWSGLYTIRSEKIVRTQNFTNRDAALEAAGLSE